jgi:hypothetical protein
MPQGSEQLCMLAIFVLIAFAGGAGGLGRMGRSRGGGGGIPMPSGRQRSGGGRGGAYPGRETGVLFPERDGDGQSPQQPRSNQPQSGGSTPQSGGFSQGGSQRNSNDPPARNTGTLFPPKRK